MGNKDVGLLRTMKKKTNVLSTIKGGKAGRTGHKLRGKCLVKHSIEGKIQEGIELTGIQVRRRKLLLQGNERIL